MKARKLIVGLLLVVAVGAGLGFWRPFDREPEPLKLNGVVEIREVRLGSKVGGRVASIHAAEGDVIRAGQLLVKLEAPELEARLRQWEAKRHEAEAELKKAENGPRKEEKDAAQAARNAAEARWARMKAGHREEDKVNARGNLDSAEAELRQAAEEFHRVERLHARGGATRSEYDAARATLDRAQGKEKAARATRDMMERGYREEEVREAEAEFHRLDAQYRLLDAGTRYEDKLAAAARVAEIEARVLEIRAQLAEAEVRAPAAAEGSPDWQAVVEVLAVRRGDVAGPNQTLLRVLQSDDLWVRVYVPETELGKVRLNQDVQVTVDSHPGRTFQGKVIQVNSVSEFTPRNIQSVDERKHQMFGIKVRVDDPQGVFKAGMAAQVVIPVEAR